MWAININYVLSLDHTKNPLYLKLISNCENFKINKNRGLGIYVSCFVNMAPVDKHPLQI